MKRKVALVLSFGLLLGCLSPSSVFAEQTEPVQSEVVLENETTEMSEKAIDSETTIETELQTETKMTIVQETKAEISTIERESEIESELTAATETESETPSESETEEREFPLQVGTVFSSIYGKYEVLTVPEQGLPTVRLVWAVGHPLDAKTLFLPESGIVEYLIEGEQDYIRFPCRITEIASIGSTVNVILPEGVEKITPYTFMKCGIETLSLPSTLTQFDTKFSFKNLELIQVAEGNPKYKTVNNVMLSADGSELLIYPCSDPRETYATPETVKVIKGTSFYWAKYLKELTLSKVEKIEEDSLSDMAKIEVLNLPSTLTRLNMTYNIYLCPNLKRVNVENGNPMLESQDGVLYYHQQDIYALLCYPASYPAETYQVPYGVTMISSFASSNMSITKEFIIPSTVKEITPDAFEKPKIPVDFVLQFTKQKMDQLAFMYLQPGSRIIVQDETVKEGFPFDFIVTNLYEDGNGLKPDDSIPIIVDYERAVSRISNWYVKGGNTYYYDAEGQLASGLQTIGNRDYYFNTDGVRQTGFQDIDGKTYYFSPTDGARCGAKGLQTIENKRYFFLEDGSICKETSVKDDTNTYYLDTATGEVLCDEKTHKYLEWETVQNPTCTEVGRMERSCRICSHLEKKSIAKTAHAYGAWTNDKAATCTSDGSHSRICTVCGEKESVVLPKTGHKYGSWTTRRATCTQTGSQTRTCSVCKIKETKVLPKLSHRYGSWRVITKATYTNYGKQSRYCVSCKKTESKTIAKLVRTNLNKVKFYGVPSHTYNGKQQKPSITAKYGGKTLSYKVDYTLSYKANQLPGKGYIYVVGKGAYTGTKTIGFYIKPKAPSLSNKSISKNKITLWVKKATGVSGYQVVYSTNKKFTTKKAKIFKSSSVSLTGLNRKRNYYVKLRSYKLVGKTKVYSSYGKTVVMKTR